MSSGASEFDLWVESFGKRGPPFEAQNESAKKLLDKTAATQAEEAILAASDRVETSLVSWKGVKAEWLLESFMKLPAIQCFKDFNRRMWFVRNTGIKEMVRQQGVEDGSIVDSLHIFRADESAIGDVTVFISYTGNYTLSHFIHLLGDHDLQGQ